MDAYLQDIRVITANKELMSKVHPTTTTTIIIKMHFLLTQAMLYIEDIIGGAASTEATVVDGEVLISLIRVRYNSYLKPHTLLSSALPDGGKEVFKSIFFVLALPPIDLLKCHLD